MIKLIIFDFDGTLADSKEKLLGIVSKNLKKRGYKINQEYKRKFGDKPLKKGLEQFGIDKKEINSLVRKIHGDFVKESGKIKLVKNIEKLKWIKIEKIIISNNIKKYILGVLKEKSGLFDEIHGWPEFEITKREEFEEILSEKGIDSNETIYAGDRAIDAKVAKKVGCISVLIANKVSWSPRNELLKARGDFIINDIKELNKVVNKINY